MRTSEIRVLSICDAFPPAYTGAGLQALRLARTLRRDRIQVEVVSFTPGEAIVEGVPVHRLSSWGTGRVARIQRLLALGLFLIRARRDYDVIHVHGLARSAYLAVVLARALGKPIVGKVAIIGDDDPLTAAQGGAGSVRRGLLRRMDRIVCTSSEVASACRMAGIHPSRLVMLPNAVAREDFPPVAPTAKSEARRALGIAENVLVVAFVGVVIARKGVDTLVDAWIELVGSLPTSTPPCLLVVGPCSVEEARSVEPDYVERLKQRLESAGLLPTVRFVGRADCVLPFLRAADVFALPSRREGLPNALLESMACGLPVIASDLQCIRDVVRHDDNGLLFPCGSSDHLQAALSSLLADPQRRMDLGRRAARTIEERFSLPATAGAYGRLYQELLNGNGDA